MKTIALILIALVGTSNSDCLKLDIILIGDMSSSAEGYQGFVSKAFTGFISKYELSDNGLQMGIITFNRIAQVVCPLTSDKKALLNKSDSIYFRGTEDYTYLELAFDQALEEFGKHGRAGYAKMIIVVSDGNMNNEYIVRMIAKNIKANDIKICSVLIKDNYERPELMKDISSDCYVESDYESLHKELRKLNLCI